MPRERKGNFSIAEINTMLEEISMHRFIVLAKEKNGPVVKAKREAWKEIASKLKEISSEERGHDDVKKKWQEMKTAVVAYIRSQHQSGDTEQEKPPFFDSILSIIRDNCDIKASGTKNVDDTIREGNVSISGLTNGSSPDTFIADRLTSSQAQLKPEASSSSVTARQLRQSKQELLTLARKRRMVNDDELTNRWLESKIRANEAKRAYMMEKMNFMKLNKYKLSLEVKKLEADLGIEKGSGIARTVASTEEQGDN